MPQLYIYLLIWFSGISMSSCSSRLLLLSSSEHELLSKSDSTGLSRPPRDADLSGLE